MTHHPSQYSVFGRTGLTSATNFEAEIVYSDSESTAFAFGLPHQVVYDACQFLEATSELHSVFCPIDDFSDCRFYEFTVIGALALIEYLKIPPHSFAVWRYLCDFQRMIQSLSGLIELVGDFSELQKQVASQREKPSYVYVIRCLSTGLFKIGRAIDIPNRVKTIQYMSAGHLVLVYQAHGGSDLESRLHKEFSHRRDHGEWFSLSEVELLRLSDLMGTSSEEAA
ncbi:TPA: GIY-YIG nuclease family protein [Aeromonas veronii]